MNFPVPPKPLLYIPADLPSPPPAILDLRRHRLFAIVIPPHTVFFLLLRHSPPDRPPRALFPHCPSRLSACPSVLCCYRPSRTTPSIRHGAPRAAPSSAWWATPSSMLKLRCHWRSLPPPRPSGPPAQSCRAAICRALAATPSILHGTTPISCALLHAQTVLPLAQPSSAPPSGAPPSATPRESML